MRIKHHSPSSLNLFCASPAMFVVEKILGIRQPVGAPAHRGTAVEAGVTYGLLNPDAPTDDCTAVALEKYDTLMALSPDRRRGSFRETISPMMVLALQELRPYGIPSQCQGYVEWKPEGLRLPIIGYFDFHWEQHNITVDLKTSERLPPAVKIPHARQVALYCASNNADGRVSYATPHKHVTFQVENIHAHRQALHRIALRVERFLSLSDDPQFYVDITAPDLESFYWGAPAARQLAFENWGI
jgi:hypothetical protein